MEGMSLKEEIETILEEMIGETIERVSLTSKRNIITTTKSTSQDRINTVVEEATEAEVITEVEEVTTTTTATEITGTIAIIATIVTIEIATTTATVATIATLKDTERRKREKRVIKIIIITVMEAIEVIATNRENNKEAIITTIGIREAIATITTTMAATTHPHNNHNQ